MRAGWVAAVVLVAASCRAAPAASMLPRSTARAAAATASARSVARGDQLDATPDRERQPISAMKRPLLAESRSFDPLALPREAALDSATVRRDGWAALSARTDGYDVMLGRDLVAELEVAGARPYRVYTGARIPAPHFRPLPERPPCGLEARAKHPAARWAGVTRTGWTESALVFERFEGVLDAASCRAHARSGWRASASAIVPGVLYGFRRADREEVVLVGPPAEWVSATVAPEEQLVPHVGTVTLVALEVKRGASASALLVVGATGLDLFDALRSSRTDTFATLAGDHPGLAVRLDVVWAEAEDAPSATVAVSRVSRLPPPASPFARSSPGVQ